MKIDTPNIVSSVSSSERLPWLDFASGVMILWMIVYHGLQQAWNFEMNGLWDVTDLSLLPEGTKAFINSEGKLEVLNPCVVFPYLHFFMPWFFYKSGQFFKKQSVMDLWRKDWKKLIKTFIFWSLIGYILYIVFGVLNDSLTLRSATYSVLRGCFLKGFVQLNGPMWFLSTLFIIRFFANILLPHRTDKFLWLRLGAIVFLGYIIAYLAYRFNHRLLPYWVANGAAGLSFFALGYAFREYEQRWWIILPCTIVYILGCFKGFAIVDMFDNQLLSGEYLLWIPISFCCLVVFNALCRYLYQKINFKFIEIIGINAMPIFATHLLLVAIINWVAVFFMLEISQWVLFCMIICSYVMFLPLMCKFVNSTHYKKIVC